MAAVMNSAMTMRISASSAASGSRLTAKPALARGVATLKSVKMGKATGRGALVVSAVRFSLSSPHAGGEACVAGYSWGGVKSGLRGVL